jgi:hypothetical protein
MHEEARAAAKQKLAGLIERVLADGQIGQGEKDELVAVYRQAVLTVSDVREVLARYVRAVQAEVLADGRVTDEERKRCRNIVSELKIPVGLLPQAFRAIIGL